ncbi:angiotensin-converting enzyme-like [Eriocheir sinensis]|uniref:angiotensin-converting enzyme-like n=1 Tax=Eriocheir sinensis TaxID=95602 RepID=UPI0021C6E698|nr:angiotensin-converting enzyme-like [Eriocheir sinensis]
MGEASMWSHESSSECAAEERDINYLFRVALALLPTLPYLLTVDVWRWKVYEGLYRPQDWNCEYWKLRQAYSGVVPTTYRSVNELDMLPTYQLAHTTTATRHYTALFMQFMILESLCEAAGHKGPLHACDLYGSEAAGRKLAEAMRLGASRAWPEVLQGLTGADHITGEPLKRYFRPLTDWLTEDALTAGLGGGLGWGASWRLPDRM